MSNVYKHFEQYLECKYSKCYYAFHLKNDFLAPFIFLIQSYTPFGLNLYCILLCVILNNQAILETATTPILVQCSISEDRDFYSNYYHLQVSSHTKSV